MKYLWKTLNVAHVFIAHITTIVMELNVLWKKSPRFRRALREKLDLNMESRTLTT